jgi:hypothetical protein
VRFFRSRYFLPAVMVPLFILGLAEAEYRWNRLRSSFPVCFPNQLTYEWWQKIDLSNPMLWPVVALHLLPDGLTPYETPPQPHRGLRYAATIVSVAVGWWVIGCWWARLLAGRHLPRHWRATRWPIVASIAVLVPIFVIGIAHDLGGGAGGPTFSTAGTATAILLLILALAECGVLRYFDRWPTLILIPDCMATLLVYAELADRDARRAFEHLSFDGRRGFIGLRYVPPSAAIDAMMVHSPTFLITELAWPTSSLAMKCSAVVLHWFSIVWIAQRRWPSQTSPYRGFRSVALGLSTVLTGLCFLVWFVGFPPHGESTGSFGAMIGFGAVAFAMARSGTAPVQEHDKLGP